MQIFAQDEIILKPVSNSYAIKGAHVVLAPRKHLTKGTVIIERGLITAVGSDVAIPADAVIIDADSLYVYAGFIDGLSRAGVAKDNNNAPTAKDRGNPTPEEAGITPYKNVRDVLHADDQALAEYRFAGFTTAHVVPHGFLFPGTGAFILLTDEQRRMVLRENTSMYASFYFNKGVYPSTDMGVMAKWRELYTQALQQKNDQAVYAANTNGMLRPVSDRVLEGFYPVIDKRMPVVMKTERVLDIYHALDLQQQFGFDLVMMNIKEGTRLIPRLKSAKTKIFLSLSLPEVVKKDSTVVLDSESAALLKRKEEAIAERVGQAQAFAKANIAFGFSSKGMKTKDIQPNLVRMVEAGLDEETALAALTVDAAALLGLSNQMGTIEKGKLANIFITDKPYFTEKSKVKYVFVEGKLFACADKPAKTKGSQTLEGTWLMTTETPRGKTLLKIIFTQSQHVYQGTLQGDQVPGALEIKGVTFENDKLKFAYEVPFEGNTYEITVEGTVTGETFKGTMDVGKYGSFPIEGKKEPKL